ncbi:MAG: hypothetical protein JO368_05165 [Acidimicrobiales bacterium]|nr:hypothetical protein [Acidimicrobiales bacterium]
MLTALVAALGDTWWQYAALFLLVAAGWAGVPLIAATAAGAAGVGASQGNLDLAAVVVVTVVAGELGGLVGYAIGRRWGRQLVQRPGKHQDYRLKVLARGEQAYERWGRLAVFFTPAMVSGTARMDYRQFVLWNLLDALGFAIFTVAGAYGIGRLVTGHHTNRDIAVLVVGLGLGSAILFIVRRHRRSMRAASRHAGS